MRRRHWLFTIPALLVALALPASVFAASGDQDTTFNQDGMSTIYPFGPHGGSIGTAVVSRGDKTVVVGIGGGQAGRSQIVVARFGPNGYKDGTCGGGLGFKNLNLSSNHDQVTNGLAVLSNDKILIAGDRYDASANKHKLVLVRLLSNCERDSSFGNDNGVFASGFGFPDGASAQDLLVLPDGKIIVTGSVRYGIGDEDIAIWRFTENGAPDATFGGGDGMTTLSAGSRSESADRVIRLSNGKLVVGGFLEPYSGGESKTMLAGFNADGSVDKSFGNLGSVTYDSTNSGLDQLTGLTQSDGKIIACINGSDDVVVLRLNPNGWPDTSWGGGDGQVRNVYDGGVGVTDCRAQADGKIVVGGRIFFDSDLQWFVARLNANGDKDLTFGHHGFNDAARPDEAFGVTLDSSGRILLAGQANGQMSVARFLP